VRSIVLGSNNGNQTDQTNQIDQETDQTLKKGNIMKTKPFFIRAEWDEEAKVWVATSDDVPGLVTEEDTLEALIEKLKIIIPELLEANGLPIGREVPFEVMTRRFEITQTAGI
jgi:predicted RNase H-like HicB family nuclease